MRIIRVGNDVLGPAHPETFSCQAHLAKLFVEVQEAEETYSQVSKISKAVHRPMDFQTLDHQFDLAIVYGFQKRYKGAEDNTIYVIKSKQLILGSRGSWDTIL